MWLRANASERREQLQGLAAAVVTEAASLRAALAAEPLAAPDSSEAVALSMLDGYARRVRVGLALRFCF